MRLTDYINQMYGECALGYEKCECQKGDTWYGTLCPHWKPCGVTNPSQLREWQMRKLKEKEDKDA